MKGWESTTWITIDVPLGVLPSPYREYGMLVCIAVIGTAALRIASCLLRKLSDSGKLRNSGVLEIFFSGTKEICSIAALSWGMKSDIVQRSQRAEMESKHLLACEGVRCYSSLQNESFRSSMWTLRHLPLLILYGVYFSSAPETVRPSALSLSWKPSVFLGRTAVWWYFWINDPSQTCGQISASTAKLSFTITLIVGVVHELALSSSVLKEKKIETHISLWLIWKFCLILSWYEPHVIHMSERSLSWSTKCSKNYGLFSQQGQPQFTPVKAVSSTWPISEPAKVHGLAWVWRNVH